MQPSKWYIVGWCTFGMGEDAWDSPIIHRSHFMRIAKYFAHSEWTLRLQTDVRLNSPFGEVKKKYCTFTQIFWHFYMKIKLNGILDELVPRIEILKMILSHPS